MATRNNFKDLKYVLTDEDTIAFNKHYLLHSKAGKKMIMEQRIIFPVLTVVVFAMMRFFKFGNTLTLVVVGLLAAASVYVLFNAEKMLIKQQEKAVRKAAFNLESINKEESILKFRDENIYSSYEGAESEIEYDKIFKVSMSETGIYLWISETSAMPIPVSAFPREEGMPKLFDYLKEKCPDATFEDYFRA